MFRALPRARGTRGPSVKRDPVPGRIGAEAREELSRAAVVDRGPCLARQILEGIELRCEGRAYRCGRIGEVAAVEDVPGPREALQGEQRRRAGGECRVEIEGPEALASGP